MISKEDEIIYLMREKDYEVNIINSYIIFNLIDMDQYEFKICLNDIDFNKPDNIVRYLTGYYELSFREQISSLRKIKRRENRLNRILDRK